MNSEILIRAPEKTDLDDLYEMQQAKRYIWGTFQLPHTSRELWEKRLTNRPEGLYSLVAVLDGKVVGNLSLATSNRPRRKHAASIGMGVNDQFAGRGVGTALMAACVDMADNWLNLVRLELSVFHDNAPAIGLYTKFGFEQEGVYKHYGFRDGEYVDALTMARIRPGFQND